MNLMADKSCSNLTLQHIIANKKYEKSRKVQKLYFSSFGWKFSVAFEKKLINQYEFA
jgi:hypothetical protein